MIPIRPGCGVVDTDVPKWEYVPIMEGHAWVWTDVTDHEINFLEDGKAAYCTAVTYEFDVL